MVATGQVVGCWLQTVAALEHWVVMKGQVVVLTGHWVDWVGHAVV